MGRRTSRQGRGFPPPVLLPAPHPPGLPPPAAAPAPPPANPLPRHLLLLPQGLLPLVLPRSAGVRGGRAARARLPRRDRLPLHPSEPPPLRVLRHVRLPRLPLARRVRGDALRERPRHRGRHARAADQHLRAHALQLLLPLGAPPGGGNPRLLLVRRPGARPSLGVAGGEGAHPAPHSVR